MSTFQKFTRRNSVTIGCVIIVVAFMAILFLETLAVARLQDQLAQQQQIVTQIKGVTDQIGKSTKSRTEQINQLNKHIDCIVTFFAQANRTGKNISDIDTCTLQNSSTGEVAPKTDQVK